MEYSSELEVLCRVLFGWIFFVSDDGSHSFILRMQAFLHLLSMIFLLGSSDMVS